MIQISCLWFLSGDLPPSYLFICEVVSSIVATKLGSSLLWDVFIGLLFSPRPTEDGLSLNHDDDVGPDVENYDDHHDDAGGLENAEKVSLNCTFSPWESMGAIIPN